MNSFKNIRSRDYEKSIEAKRINISIGKPYDADVRTILRKIRNSGFEYCCVFK